MCYVTQAHNRLVMKTMFVLEQVCVTPENTPYVNTLGIIPDHHDAQAILEFFKKGYEENPEKYHTNELYVEGFRLSKISVITTFNAEELEERLIKEQG